MSKLMSAVRLTQIGQPLQLQQIPIPEIGPADVLVRVAAAGICHSDVHYRAGLSPAGPLPLTLGHEVAGTVARVGALVPSFQPGDRVCVHYLATCGECGGEFVAHAYDPTKGYVCGLCHMPARAGKTRRSANAAVAA